jgi:hypothetical protein
MIILFWCVGKVILFVRIRQQLKCLVSLDFRPAKSRGLFDTPQQRPLATATAPNTIGNPQIERFDARCGGE